MKSPLIEFYYQCMETGKMPWLGLCASINDIQNGAQYKSILDTYFTPTYKNRREYDVEKTWWGISNADAYNSWGCLYEFNEFRQNVVLLLAAMCCELE